MAEQKLDLLQLAARFVTEVCTGSSKVMRREVGGSELLRIGFDDMPDNFLSRAVAPGSSGSANARKYSSTRNSGSGEPYVDGSSRWPAPWRLKPFAALPTPMPASTLRKPRPSNA